MEYLPPDGEKFLGVCVREAIILCNDALFAFQVATQ